MQRFSIILFVFQLLVFQANAFQQAVQPMKHLSQEDGLLSSVVNAIEQDALGFMWFGTDVGLTRYDGYRFKNYTVSEGLPGNRVTGLKYDSQGRLWIMAKGQLCYLFEGKFYYHDKPLPEQPKNAQITSFTLTKNGHLWFTTKEKLIALDSTLNELVWTSDSIKNMPFNNPKIQFEDNQGALWIHNDDNYMLRITGEDIALVSLESSSSANNFIQAACVDDDIFYTNGTNLIRLDQSNASIKKLPKAGHYLDGLQETVVHLPNKKPIQSKLPFLTKDSKGRIWTAESDGGFVILHDSENSTFKLPEDIIASNMYEDVSGNLWFATRNQGVYFLDASAYSAANSIRLFLSKKSVQNICSSGDYTFVIANNNLYRFDELQDSFYLQKDIPGDINAITFLNKEDILLSYENEIVQYNNGIQNKYDIQQVSVMTASGGNLYYGARKQLRQITFEDLSKPSNDKSILNRPVTCVFIDKKGQKWIGTEEGLYKYAGDDSTEDHPDRIFVNSISGIGQTDDGTIWVATKDTGVFGFRDGEEQIIHINTDNYLDHNYCTGLVAESDILWVSTRTSIHKIADIDFKKQLYYLSYLSGKDVPQLTGIQSIAVNNKHVFIGTQQGLIQVKKQYFGRNYDENKVVITDIFQGNNKPLALNDLVELTFKNNAIRINYAAINYAQQNNIVYQYRMNMKGAEGEWKKTKDVTTPIYVLQPGSHTFEVQAFGGSWKKSSEIAKLDISVSKPFTQTTGFRLLMAFLGAIILISLYRIYNDDRQKTRLKEVVAQKTADLKENVNELERANNELEEFNYVVAHDLKAPLRSIYSFSQLLQRTDGKNISTAGKDYIGFMQQSALSLQETIEDLLSFSSIDKTDNIETEVNLNGILDNALDNLQGIIEMNNVQIERSELPTISANRAHMLQVFQNLISNGIKYQPKDNQPIINIDYAPKGNEWLFAVKDNGIGINKEYEDKVFRIFQRLHSAEEYTGTGIGLPIVKKIIESNGGKIWFDSELGKGTTFFFTLPKT